jgi:hypothetical protein
MGRLSMNPVNVRKFDDFLITISKALIFMGYSHCPTTYPQLGEQIQWAKN